MADYSRIPTEVIQEIHASIADSISTQKRLLVSQPDLIATGLPYESRLPHAYAVLQQLSHVVQCARYHLLAAHLERAYYSKYAEQPKEETADCVAFFLFTSFAVHSVAAEKHLDYCITRLFGIPVKNTKKPYITTPFLLEELDRLGEGAYSAALRPLTQDVEWQWLRDYRHRWAHMNPLRVAGSGLNFDSSYNKVYWQKIEDPEASEKWQMGVGGGDGPEISLDEMLSHGRLAFACIVGSYAAVADPFMTRLESEWQQKASLPGKLLLKHLEAEKNRRKGEP